MITLITVMVWRTIERLMKPRYNFHSLRHFAASWFIEQGFSAQRVQEIMGHKSIQTTFDIYGHLFPNDDDHKRLATAEAALFAPGRNKL